MGAEVHVGLGDAQGREGMAPVPSPPAPASRDGIRTVWAQGCPIIEFIFIPWAVSSAAGTRPVGCDLCLNFGFITNAETVVLATDLSWIEQSHVRPMCGPYSREIRR